MLAFYDMAIAPMSYDFVTFMVAAKSIAEPVDVVFVPGPNRGFKENTLKPIDHDEMVFRFTHLILPMVPLFGCTYTVLSGRPPIPKGHHFPPGGNGPLYPNFAHTLGNCFKEERAELVKKARPWPQPSERAKKMVEKDFPEPPFVITLRETYVEGRNSSDAWLELAKHAEDVVVVRDTDKATEPWHGFPTSPLASVDIDYRLALYHRAKMNFAVSGGPPMLLYYSGLPYRVFKMLSDSWAFSSEKYLTKVGLPPGSQTPWATEDQRIVWEDDTADVLIREYDDWRQNAKA